MDSAGSVAISTLAGLGSSFEAYVNDLRSEQAGITKTLDRALQRRGRNAPASHLVLLHSSYPPSLTGRSRQGRPGAALGDSSGRGTGKSALLRAIGAQLQADERRCSVFSFSCGGEHYGTTDHVFEELILPTLLEGPGGFLSALTIGNPSVSQRISVFARRTALVSSQAVPVLLAPLVFLATVLGAKAFELLSLSASPPRLLIAVHWISQHASIILALNGVLLVLAALYTVGRMLLNSDLREQWASRAEPHPDLLNFSARAEHFMHHPSDLIRRTVHRGKTLALLLDDVHCMDGRSFQALSDLFEASKKQRDRSLLLVISYNPRHPAIHQHSRMATRLGLEPGSKLYGEATRLELPTPTLDDLRAWLSAYCEHGGPLDVLDRLLSHRPEMASEVGVLLEFFIQTERDAGSFGALGLWNDRRLLECLEQHRFRARRMAQELLAGVGAGEGGELALELLKWILAFKRLRVPVAPVHGVVPGMSPAEIERAEARLLEEESGVLDRRRIDDQEVLTFRQDYLRPLLDSEWEEWRHESARYHSTLFRYLHEKTSCRADAEIALSAEPSQLAIQALVAEGEYNFRYAGASDAGYALRYYGQEGGGALGKWLRMYEWRIEANEDLTSLVEWDGDARVNAWRGLSSRPYPRTLFFPEVFLTAARLYAMSGEEDVAIQLLETRWPEVADRLLESTSGRLRKRVYETDLTIRAYLAEMLRQRAGAGDWSRARTLCIEVRESRAAPALALAKADATMALIEHVRAVAVGNELPPLHFLRDGDQLTFLRAGLQGAGKSDKDSLLLGAAVTHAWVQIAAPGVVRFPIELDVELEVPAPTEVVASALAGALDAFRERLREAIKRHKAQSLKGIQVDREMEAFLLNSEALYFHCCAQQYALLGAQMGSNCLSPHLGSTVEALENQLDDCRTYWQTLDSLLVSRAVGEETFPKFAEVSLATSKIALAGLAPALTDAQDTIRKARDLVGTAYTAGLRDLLALSQDRGRLAATVYRRLGHIQGEASVSFALAQLHMEFDSPRHSEVTPSWQHAMMDLLASDSSSALDGVQRIRAGLFAARWAAIHDVPTAVECNRMLAPWLAPGRLNISPLCWAEVLYQTAQLIGNQENPLYPPDVVTECLRNCNAVFRATAPDPAVISTADIEERLLTATWWITELQVRACRVEPLQSRKQLLARQILSECENLIATIPAPTTIEATDVLQKLRVCRAQALVVLGEGHEGYTSLEEAALYFRNGRGSRNPFELLQVLAHLVNIGLSRDDDTEVWRECKKRAFTAYFPELESVARELQGSRDSLSFVERSLLVRVATLLGVVWSNLTAPLISEAIPWLELAFSLLSEMGLFGQAVLLDELMSPLLHRVGDPALICSHQQRVMSAVDAIDWRRERLPFDRVYRIIAKYESLRRRKGSVTGSKENVRVMVERQMARPNPDLPSILRDLEEATTALNPDDPEEVDIWILRLLQGVHYRLEDARAAATVAERLEVIESAVQSRDYLDLAKYYARTGRSPRLALEIAAHPQRDNPYAQDARGELARYLAQRPPANERRQSCEGTTVPELGSGAPMGEGRGGRPADSGEEDVDSDRAMVMELPLSRMDVNECAALLRILEKTLRATIVEHLTRRNPNWWSENVPLDVRENAEARRAESEQQPFGVRDVPREIQEYFDFSDYVKIITWRKNWNSVFKEVFSREDAVRVKLDELRVSRNAVVHGRSLSREELELFVLTARQIIRACWRADGK